MLHYKVKKQWGLLLRDEFRYNFSKFLFSIFSCVILHHYNSIKISTVNISFECFFVILMKKLQFIRDTLVNVFYSIFFVIWILLHGFIHNTLCLLSNWSWNSLFVIDYNKTIKIVTNIVIEDCFILDRKCVLSQCFKKY